MSLLHVGCCTAFLMRFLLFALAGSIRPTFLSRNEPPEIFRMPEFAKLNPREIFEKTRFAKLNPREIRFF